MELESVPVLSKQSSYSLLILLVSLFSCAELTAQRPTVTADSILKALENVKTEPVELPDLGPLVTYKMPPLKSRIWLVAGGHAALWTGTYIALNKAWYEGYDRTGFHTFDDLREWNQIDKAGHIWTTYQLGRLSGELWKWTGLNHKKSVWLGGISAMAFQSIIELQDAYSAEWGFSWSDIAANTIGAAAYVSQELGWKEQRIQIKMGYFPYKYPSELKTRADKLFGSGPAERILKDYNSQTYWLSANLDRFFPEAHFPKWLNISAGYSSDILLGGEKNSWVDGNGQTVDRTDLARTRRYYLSVDVDLTRIPTRKKWLRTTFQALNAIKIPAPAIEYNNGGKFRWHWLHQ